MQQRQSLASRIFTGIGIAFIVCAYLWADTERFKEEQAAEAREAAHEKANLLRERGELTDDANRMLDPIAQATVK